MLMTSDGRNYIYGVFLADGYEYSSLCGLFFTEGEARVLYDKYCEAMADNIVSIFTLEVGIERPFGQEPTFERRFSHEEIEAKIGLRL